MTLPYGSPDDVPTIEESEAVAAASEARATLRQDGAAPSRDAILREMGRRPDGSPLPDGPREITAGEAARRLLDEDGVDVVGRSGDLEGGR